MKPTQIIYAHPETIALMAENTITVDGHKVPRRFTGWRVKFWDRLEAALLVFRGEADALVWYEDMERAKPSEPADAPAPGAAACT